jgi:hypothetical protein
MKINAIALLSSLALAGSALAGPVIVNAPVETTKIVPSAVFRDQEFFFDVYGSYLDRTSNQDSASCACSDDNSKRHGFGGGLAAGEFFNPYLGARVDVNFSSVHDAKMDVAADFLFRVPIKDTQLSAYALVGGGVEVVNGSHSLIHLGGGLEYRITPTIGIFTEATYGWVFFPDERDENLTIKLGVRYAY